MSKQKKDYISSDSEDCEDWGNENNVLHRRFDRFIPRQYSVHKYFVMGFLLGLVVGMFFQSMRQESVQFDFPMFETEYNLVSKYEHVAEWIRDIWINPPIGDIPYVGDVGIEWEQQLIILSKLLEKGNRIKLSLIINTFGSTFDGINSKWLTTLQLTERLIEDYNSIRTKAEDIGSILKRSNGVKTILTRSLADIKQLKSLLLAFQDNWDTFEKHLQESISSLTSFNYNYEHIVLEEKKIGKLRKIREELCDMVTLFGVECSDTEMEYHPTTIISATQSINLLNTAISIIQ